MSMNFDNKNSTFTRLGSFRQATITERLQDPQMLKPSPPKPSPTPNSSMPTATNDTVEKRLSADSRYAHKLDIRLCDSCVFFSRFRARDSDGILGSTQKPILRLTPLIFLTRLRESAWILKAISLQNTENPLLKPPETVYVVTVPQFKIY